MIQVTPRLRILIAKEPLDFRAGIDGTAAVCRRVIAEDPMSGTLFVFRNRQKSMLRFLVYDGQGFWLMTKRLSSGRFSFWTQLQAPTATPIEGHQLHVLLAGGDWTQTAPARHWRKIE